MSRDLRATLVITERVCDEDAIVVEHSYGSTISSVKKVEWRHVDDLRPGGSLPHWTIWRPLCHAALGGNGFRSDDGVMRLRQRIDDLLRENYNIVYQQFPKRCKIACSRMAALDDGRPRRQAEHDHDQNVKRIKAWGFADWYSRLFDDAPSCGPSRGPLSSPGTRSLCGGCSGDTTGALKMPPSDVDASLRCGTQAPKRASTCSSVPVVGKNVSCGEKRRRLDVRVDITDADCTGSDEGDVQSPYDGYEWPDSDFIDDSPPPSPDLDAYCGDPVDWLPDFEW